MNLALFDLDHTLIPFDSGLAWVRFLTARQVLPAEAEAQYLAYCFQYQSGTLDIREMHRASVQPLTRLSRSRLKQWLCEFEVEMAPRVPQSMRSLVRQHQQAGDLCAIVTATMRLIAEPFAHLFGIDHLVATEPATIDGTPDGALTAEIAGEPCFREQKVTRVNRWLAQRQSDPPSNLGAFRQSWFYSDSVNDLPLLRAVSHPVAVRPDVRLRELAKEERWPILDLD